MPRLTILTLALTAAVASHAAPSRPAPRTPAPKKPVEAPLPVIEVGKPPTSRGSEPTAPTPALSPSKPAKETPSPSPTFKAKPAKSVEKPAPASNAATVPLKHSEAAKTPASPTVPRTEIKPPKPEPGRTTPSAAAASRTAPSKPVKEIPAPKKPLDIDLPAIEVGLPEEPTPRKPQTAGIPPKAAAVKPPRKARAVEKSEPVQKEDAEVEAPRRTAPGAPKAAVVATMATPPKSVKKTPEGKKPAPALMPTVAPKAPQPTVQRPPQPAPAPKVEGPRVYTLSAPIDVTTMVREGQATLTSSKVLGGKPEYLFDPNRSTEVVSLATSTGPAFWQITLDRSRPLDAVDLSFGEGGPFQWTLSGANSAADLQSRQGSYRLIVPARAADLDDQAVIPSSPESGAAYRVYRLEVKPVAGAGEVRLASLALWTPQELERVEIDAMIPRVGVGSRLPLKAIGRFELGARQNLTPDVTWEVTPPEAGKVDSLVRLEGKAAGKATVTAVFKDTRSSPFVVDILSDAKPDWSVTYIERGPRVPIDGPAPKNGQKVVWFAHVKNYGAADAPQVAAEWRVDGKTVATTTVAKLDRFKETDVMLPLPWDGKRHYVELVVDPAKQIAEESEANNALSVATDALSVGMWVEESVVRYFHLKQRDLGVGSNGWEDWAQRQIASWNRSQAQTAGLFQQAPDAGVRWRLDRLLIVSDGLLPMAGGSPELDPDRRERSVHLMLGFPAIDPSRSPYRKTSGATPDNPFFLQKTLLKSLTRAIYPQAPPPPTAAAGG